MLTFNNQILFTLVITISGCKPDDGLTSLINISDENPGLNCKNGGYKIQTGIDKNRNGTLEPEEVQATTFICNGINGISTLINSSEEPSGINCPVGGVKIEIGADANFNGVLDASEIAETHYICSGGYESVVKLVIHTTAFENANLDRHWSNTDWKLLRSDLVYFNINNYLGIDSAIFVVEGVRTTDSSSRVHFDLYNLTGNVSVPNSEIFTNQLVAGPLVSSNILQYLPDSTCDLAWRVKVDSAGIEGWAYGSFLFLYRK